MWAESEEGRASPYPENTQSVTPEPEIGLALCTGFKHNRKSRSTNELQHMPSADEHDEGRRRSAEIAYWRTSYTAQQKDTHADCVTQPENTANSFVAVPQDPHYSFTPGPHDVPESFTSEPAGACSSPSELSMVVDGHDREDNRSLPPRNSPVEDYTRVIDGHAHQGTFLTTSSDLPLKESQVESPEEGTNDTEKRLSKLEETMQSLETSVIKLSSRNNRQTIVIGDVPKDRRSRHKSKSSKSSPHYRDQYSEGVPTKNSSETARRPSASSSWKAPSVQSSKMPTPSLGYSSTSTFETDNAYHIPKRSTSYGAMIQQQQPPPGERIPSSNIYDHLAPLYKALHDERSIRKTLESQIGHLQHQVYELSTIIHHLSANSDVNKYPTPSPDQPVGRSSIETEKDYDTRRRAKLEQNATSTMSRFSMVDTTDESSGECDSESEVDTVSANEVFQTPMEAMGSGFGFDRKDSNEMF